MAELDINKISIIFFLAVIVVGVATTIYREQLGSDAHQHIRQICENQPVATGAYARCLKQPQAAP